MSTRTAVAPVAPSRADAERAAAALARAGVGRVVLFGSVARGDATERSDIDLVAIYDDLDYRERWKRRCELKKLAERVVEFPVDVSVTDRAEWRMRTTRVRTSFEGRVARRGVVLLDRSSASGVDPHKEMVMPVSDYEEALKRLDEARAAIGDLRVRLGPNITEQGDLGMVEKSLRVLDRLHRGCGDAQMVIELSVKALIHLEADAGRTAWGHDIEELCSRLSEPHRSAVAALLEPVDPDEITLWHTEAVYLRTGRGLEVSAEVLAELARAACRVASYTADRFPADVHAAGSIRRYAVAIAEYLDSCDIETGEPL